MFNRRKSTNLAHDTTHAPADASTLPSPEPADAWSRLGAVDHIVVRLILDRALATRQEIDRAIAHLQTAPTPNPPALAEVLIEHGYITRTQYQRLKESIEAARSFDLPGYEVLDRIASGAAGTVFRARQIALDRIVAVKLIREGVSEDEREGLEAEARAAARLNHPNIVQAIDVGRTSHHHYFVMEYVEGRTLDEVIKERTRLDEAHAIDIIIAIAGALAHAHQRGLIHRDVKPRNVILTHSGQAKLADLGLARLLADHEQAAREKGKAMGTPFFISPEQARGDEHIGPESDIYSLGATFYYALTGAFPFPGTKWREVMQKHLDEPLTPPITHIPDLTPGVSELIEKMMAKSPNQRFPNCDALLAELNAWRAYHILRRAEERPPSAPEHPASA